MLLRNVLFSFLIPFRIVIPNEVRDLQSYPFAPTVGQVLPGWIRALD
jgi:hypothetical protein